MSNETAENYGLIFKDKNIEITVHAPYYINFANPSAENFENSCLYILACLQKMKFLGAKKLVFHPGTLLKNDRETAFEITYSNIKALLSFLDEFDDLGDYYLCPETMGKHGQVGSVEEIAKICALDERLMPTLDFGHINAFSGGALKTEKDFDDIFDILEKYLGSRYKNVHIHFSKIEYGKKGEIKHLTFDDETYGPEFENLAKVLKKRNINASIICESAGTQTRDACIMKKIYNQTTLI